MSIYEGTVGEQEYRHGFDEGRAAAELMTDAGALTHEIEAEARGNADTTRPRTRAFWLGWLRGFREVSR